MGTPEPAMELPADVSWVRLLWCDNAGIIRAKAFHAGVLETHGRRGIGISMAQQSVHSLADAVAPGAGLGPVGEVWLRPDWPTFTPLPYAKGHARVYADMVDGEGDPWPLCPRTFLRNAVSALAEAGFTMRAAFEQEFTLLRREGAGLEPADRTLFAMTAAMDDAVEIIGAITEALVAQGIQPACYYAESAPGQHEISIAHDDPLAAADHQIALRETVKAAASSQGLLASFLPKIFPDQAGNGCHLHLSLWQGGVNVTGAADATVDGRHALSREMRWFLAGILDHLPALLAVTAASPNSYRRLQPQSWAGAYRCWGVDNREAAVRVPSSPAPETPTHIEVKAADATGNPYLVLGCVIHAGLDGIRRRLEPPEPVTCDPATLSDEQRGESGIDRLPADLPTAIAALEDDAVLMGALGEPLSRAFLAVRRAEAHALEGVDLSAEVQLLIDRY